MVDLSHGGIYSDPVCPHNRVPIYIYIDIDIYVAQLNMSVSVVLCTRAQIIQHIVICITSHTQHSGFTHNVCLCIHQKKYLRAFCILPWYIVDQSGTDPELPGEHSSKQRTAGCT